jgi:hypothetical protein
MLCCKLQQDLKMKYFASLLFLVFTMIIHGQSSNFNSQRNWSMNKHEIMIGFGATQFLGDLGGRDRIGKDYSLGDIDMKSTGVGGMLGYRFRFHPRWATSSILNLALVRGNDALTKEIIRESRNLRFRSPIAEFEQRLELIVFANERVGHRFNLSGLSGFKSRNEQIYLFSGVGVAYFNPQALYKDEWTALRPLTTEGQGLEGGPPVVKPYTLTVPFGIGARFGVTQMIRVGIEATYIKTFSDYIDDVHGVYYDPDALLAQKGAASAYLSNPSQKNQTWFIEGQQRGDKQNDAYFLVNLVVTKNITYRSYTVPKRKMVRRKGRYKF